MNRLSARLAVAFVLLGLSAWASAQTTRSRPSDPATKSVRKTAVEDGEVAPGREFDGLWRTIAALAAVVALIFAVRFAIRRLAPSAAASRRSDVARVVWQKTLTPKHQVFLLQMGRRVVLVGTGPGGMDLLMQTSDEGEVNELLRQARPGRADKTPEETQDKSQ